MGGRGGDAQDKGKSLEQVFWISDCYYPAKEQEKRTGGVRYKSREREVHSQMVEIMILYFLNFEGSDLAYLGRKLALA